MFVATDSVGSGANSPHSVSHPVPSVSFGERNSADALERHVHAVQYDHGDAPEPHVRQDPAAPAVARERAAERRVLKHGLVRGFVAAGDEETLVLAIA